MVWIPSKGNIIYYNNCTAAPSEVRKPTRRKTSCCWFWFSNVFETRIYFKYFNHLDNNLGKKKKLGFPKTTTRLEAQISQAKGKAAAEKQKDFVLTWSSHTSKQGLRRQPARGDRTNASCNRTTSVPRGRVPLLGIFRRPEVQEKGAWREKGGERNLLQCQQLCFTTPASHCSSLGVAENEKGSETWSLPCFYTCSG